MRNQASALQEGKKGLMFTSLAAAVTALTLTIVAEGASGFRTSEPTVIKNQTNVPDNTQIVFEEGVLSVSLHDADLEEVLKEISRQSNIRIDLHGHIRDRVTLQFVNLPLEKGLKRLLKNQDYSFIYSEKKDTAGSETRYVLSRVVFLGALPSGRKENEQSLMVPEKPDLTPSSHHMSLDEIPADLINELLSQDPQVQEKAFKTLAETINSSLREAHTQLIHALLSEYGMKEGKDSGLEGLGRLLREGEFGKTEPKTTD